MATTTRVRVPSAVALAAAIAAMTSWVLRDHAQFLPSGDARPNPLAGSAHGHADGGYQPPPPIAGEPMVSYLGLTVFALHALMIVVIVVAAGVRRWPRRSTVDGPSVLVLLAFAAAVAVVSGLVVAGMASVLLGSAISFAATMTAAATVLRYAFVLALAFSAVFGLP